jgi:hypothetical protein
MFADHPERLYEIRNRFAHVKACPFEGPRIFLESAGGARRGKSVIETPVALCRDPHQKIFKAHPTSTGSPRTIRRVVLKGFCCFSGSEPQQNLEPRACIFKCYFATRRGDDFMGNRKAKPAAALVGARETGQHRGALIGRNSRTIIADRENDLIRCGMAANRDFGFGVSRHGQQGLAIWPRKMISLRSAAGTWCDRKAQCGTPSERERRL